ncbi:MAG: hypothetical protein JWP74_535 [Marmoricola sp.]|nr:hypothetical protein [Marmoricola sp.]
MSTESSGHRDEQDETPDAPASADKAAGTTGPTPEEIGGDGDLSQIETGVVHLPH